MAALVGSDTQGVVDPATGRVVGIPAIEPTFEGSVPALVALREAVETLQGVRGPQGASLSPVTGVGPVLASGALLAGDLVVGTTPVALPGLVLPVKGGRSYSFEFKLAVRVRAGSPGLTGVVARPSGAFVAAAVTANTL